MKAGHVKMQTQTRVTQLQDKKCQGLMGDHQRKEDARKDSLLEPLEGRGPANTLILDLLLTEQRQ